MTDAGRTMLVFCDDPSHTANPVGPIITDPDPVSVVADDVYIDELFIRKGDSYWSGNAIPELLPPRSPQNVYPSPDAAPTYSPRCRAKTPDGRVCGQRGGRWKLDDRDKVFTQLAERGITGVSMRGLDLIKHSGIRSML